MTGWYAPGGAVASLDLRSEPQCAATMTPDGFGLFVTPNAVNLGSDYSNLGTDPTQAWNQQQLNRWQSALGLPNALTANNLRGVVWETLTIQSDPTGLDRCRPLVPTAGQPNYEVWLAGELIGQKRFQLGDPEATPLIDQLKRIYRAIRQDSIDGKHRDAFGNVDLSHYRKVLGHWVRKYRIAYRNFQPADLPDEPDLEPTTTITENFNQSNSTTLGPNLTWSEVTANWGTTNNLAGRESGTGSVNGSARAEHDLSSADHYAQAELYKVSDLSAGGVVCRHSSSASTFYASTLGGTSDNTIYLFKQVAGADTVLASTSVTKTNGQIIKVQSNGTTIKSVYNGTERSSVTDSSIAGNTRCGLVQYYVITEVLDNFEAADLAAAVGSHPFPRRPRRVRNLLRM